MMSTEAPKPPFEKILIANRGEIACRVAKTARRMGIKTVAVYSEADARSVHVKMCDEAVCVGPAPALESYLNIDAIIAAMHMTGAQAVHPGYGFLSENAAFVERLENEGLVFIGPKTFAIKSMGDKIESKALAMKAGVSTIPGQLGLITTEADAVRVSNEVGYPVMIKASAGGGGKGMRVAKNDKEAAEGFRLSKAEAAASFGDDRIFIERFVDQPRHIEIQIIADSHGNCVYLPERECSIQRRNQKVIEEAPSPFIDEKTWRAMGEQACRLAQAVQYQSAGTVEMMVDGAKNFYFLEMNTRLQVEHPVTELVTGLDLVEIMIRVAAGEKLSVKQEDVKAKGWAMESRIYAEDSTRSFLPSVGVLHRYVTPKETDPSAPSGVRVDTGVEEGSEISIFYDPMIAKLVTWGPTRDVAISTMKDALDRYVIKGVVSNVNFVRDVMDNKRFLSGDMTTHFIDEEYPAPGFRGHILKDDEADDLASIAGMMHMQHKQQSKIYLDPKGSFIAGKPTVGRAALVGVMHPDEIVGELDLVVTMEGQVGTKVVRRVHVKAKRPKLGDVISTDFRVNVLGDVVHTYAAPLPANSGIYLPVRDGGIEHCVQMKQQTNTGYVLSMAGSAYTVTIRSEAWEELAKIMPVKVASEMLNELRTPMPGKVHSIAVREGEEVIAGQELCVVEAMKMQNVLRASKDSVVDKIMCKVGDNLNLNDLMISFRDGGATS